MLAMSNSSSVASAIPCSAIAAPLPITARVRSFDSSAGSLSATAAEVVGAMGAAAGGLVTLYYGGAQREKDAARLADELGAVFPDADVEYYYGGMKNAEYWISLDE